MDKRKVIILAIVLFLFIGLGTFVFAQNGSDENGNGQGNNTIDTPDNNGGDNGQDTPSGTEDDGETEEGGNTGTDNTTTAGGNGGENEQPGEEPNTPNEPTTPENPDTPVDNTKAELLAALKAIQEKIDNADALDDIDSARVDRTDELVSAVEELDDAELNDLLDEINRVLDDSTKPLITPEDLDGSYNNASVAITISDDTATNYTLTLNGDPVENPDLDELIEEGTYTLTVTDEAFNETTVTFTIDKTDPVLFVNGSKVENDDVIYVNKDAKMTVDEDNLESFTSNDIDISEALINNGYWTAQKDGEYNIEVTDKAGNKTTYKVVVDKTPIAVNHLYVLNNTHNDYNVSEENRYKVVGNGQELYFEYVLKEEFTSTPKLTIGGKEYKMTCDVASWDDELFKCDAHVTISEDMNLVNGEVIPFTITGVKDIAGNETVVTEKDTTVSDKYGKVVYDSDPAQSIWVYILNDDEDHRTIIGDNQKLIVEINVDEELLVNPVITIGKYQVELTRRANDSRYIYSKTITIDADKMNLVHDEDIKFAISVTDVAGNTTTFDNNNVTYHEEKGYGQVKYDGEAPEYVSLGMQNNDHTSSHENGDITVANIGDHIRVLIRFDELLAITPKIRIGDSEEFELKLHTDYENFEKYTYWADIELTKDMNLADGALEYVIYGYADAFGNVGKNLSSTDEVNPINNPSLPGVTLDTEVENPEWIYTLNLSDKNNRKTIKDGQTLRVEANFTEELVTTPVLTIGDSQSVAFRKCEETSFGKYVCVADIVIDNSIANLENNKVIPIKITNIEDKGGNTLELDNSYITETTEYGEVTYDNEAPVYTSLGLVNMTHFDEDSKGDNLYVANVGDKLRVIIFFDELLATDPTVTIGGVSEKLHHDEDWENYGYWADIEITEEMNLEDGNIDFVVSGYADAVGNVGVDLTSKDIKNSPHKGVRLDTIAAKKHAVYLWANTESVVENIDGKDYVVYYVTNGDVVTATISVNEILGENPKFVIGYNGGSYEVLQDQVIFRELDDVEDFKYVYSAQITIPEDVTTENTELTLTVYNVVDQAGNVTNNGEAIGISNVNRIFVDTVAPEIEVYKNSKVDDANNVTSLDKYNYYVGIKANDEFIKSVTVNGEEYDLDKMPAFGVSNDVKDYVVVAADKAGNKTEIQFTIDTKYPIVEINGTQYQKTINNIRVDEANIKIIEDNISSLIVTKDGQKLSDYDSTTTEFTLSEEGLYTIEVKDNNKNGNKTTVEFYVGKYDTEIVFDIPDSFTYDANSVEGEITAKLVNKITGETIKENLELTYFEGNMYGVNRLESAPTDAGTYTVSAYFYEDADNKTAHATAVFEIEKALTEIKFTIPDNIFYDGEPVDDIEISVVANGKEIANSETSKGFWINYYNGPTANSNNLIGTEAPTNVGNYWIAVNYVDSTGNYTNAWDDAEFTIVADTTKPDVGDLENNAIYFGNIPYYMTDENGIDYVYYDFSHNYTSCSQLIGAYNQGVIDRSDVGGLKAYPENGAGVYDVSWLPSDKITGVSFCAVDKAGNDTFVGGITIYKNANATTVVEAINNGGNITIPSNVAPITISGNSLSIPANTYINGNNLLTIIDTLNIANDYITISYTNITGGINITGNYSSLENSVISGAIDIG